MTGLDLQLEFESDKAYTSFCKNGRSGRYYVINKDGPEKFVLYHTSWEDKVHWIFRNRFEWPIHEVTEIAEGVFVRIQGGPNILLDFCGNEIEIYKDIK